MIFKFAFLLLLHSTSAIAFGQHCFNTPSNVEQLKSTCENVGKYLKPFQILLQRDPELGFFLKIGDHVKVDLITKEKLPKYFTPSMDFAGVQQHFQSQGRQVLYMVVGPYHDRKGEVEGLTVDDGLDVGYPSIFPDHSAMVSILNSQLTLLHLPTASKRKIKKLIVNTKESRGDLFQQHFAIYNKVTTPTRYGQPTEESTQKYTMRFLVEFNDGIQGVVQIDRALTWRESMAVLKSANVKNAVYLDMGALSHGVLVDNSGQAWITGTGLPPKPLADSKLTYRNYTNLLVFYIEKDSSR